MQLQALIASALLLSGLASAVNLPRDEADNCVQPGGSCNAIYGPSCCNGFFYKCSPGGTGGGVSVAIHSVFASHLTLAHRLAFSVRRMTDFI